MGSNEFALAEDESTVPLEDVLDGREKPEAMRDHVVSVAILKPSFIAELHVLEEEVQEMPGAFLQSLLRLVTMES